MSLNTANTNLNSKHDRSNGVKGFHPFVGATPPPPIRNHNNLNRYKLVAIVLNLHLLVAGCGGFGVKFGDNYNYQSDRQMGKQVPLEAIAKWLGKPLPASYSDLRYEIIADTPDPQAKISVKVPEFYYKSIVQNVVDYDIVKSQLQNFDLVKPREMANDPGGIIQKPLPSTRIWVSKTGTYRRYIWYQGSVLYLVYASQ
ncbi:hypothetical protein [Pseudanabaena sp. PCC 6802]|uniref:hypothetical protein n=1 Tax=Pseudanabaena sp. PCC 6802 TaxID=118173 RepID=UPI00035F53B3|nr:hypothetical protein [Pseudanabaena sp. PCC 6802]